MDINKRERLYNLITALYNGKKLRYESDDGEFIVLGKPFGIWEASIYCGGGHRIPLRKKLGAHELSSMLLAQPQKFKAESETPIISEYACTSCGSHELIPVIWGLVEAEYSDGELIEENIKILEQEDRGEVYLGGCVPDSFLIDKKEPTHWCRACEEYLVLTKGGI